MGKYQFYDDAVEYAPKYSEAAKKVVYAMEQMEDTVSEISKYESAGVSSIIEQLNALYSNLGAVQSSLVSLKSKTIKAAATWKAKKILEEKLEEARRRQEASEGK